MTLSARYRSGPWFWPVFDDEDPLGLQQVLAERETRSVDGDEPAQGTKVAVITCLSWALGVKSRRQHAAGQSPPVAELWSTSLGPVFKSRIEGRPGEPPDWFFGQTPQPVATMAEATRSVYADNARETWQDKLAPTTYVVVLLAWPETHGRLWVKCPLHGPFKVDPGKLVQETRVAGERRGRDTHSLALRLEDVLAVE